jgi:hypothetical protein
MNENIQTEGEFLFICNIFIRMEPVILKHGNIIPEIEFIPVIPLVEARRGAFLVGKVLNFGAGEIAFPQKKDRISVVFFFKKNSSLSG